MKRYTVFTLTFLLVLSLIGCNANLPEDKETFAPTAETSNISAVMDGEIEMFIRAFLGKRDD